MMIFFSNWDILFSLIFLGFRSPQPYSFVMSILLGYCAATAPIVKKRERDIEVAKVGFLNNEKMFSFILCLRIPTICIQ